MPEDQEEASEDVPEEEKSEALHGEEDQEDMPEEEFFEEGPEEMVEEEESSSFPLPDLSKLSKKPRKKEDRTSALLGYLESLAAALPPEKKREFAQSEMRLKIESLRARLAGQTGFREECEKRRSSGNTEGPADGGGKGPITTERLEGTFQYISSISGFHPDKDIGAALKDRLKNITSRLHQKEGNDG